MPITKQTSVGKIIKDFEQSDAPQFKNKSKEKIKQMALAAFYSKQNEEVELEEGRPSQQHPISGHPYHSKTNDQLHFIIRDAGEAAKAMKNHNPQAESKYLDQQNDAATVLGFRKRAAHPKTGNLPNWYLNKYFPRAGVKEEVELSEGPIDFSSFAKRKAAENKARMKAEREAAKKNAPSIKRSAGGGTTIRYGKKIDSSDPKLHKALEDHLGGSFEHFESEPRHGHNEHGHATMVAHVTHSYTHEDMGLPKDEMEDTAETYKIKVTKHPQHGYQIGHLMSKGLGEEVELDEFYSTKEKAVKEATSLTSSGTNMIEAVDHDAIKAAVKASMERQGFKMAPEDTPEEKAARAERAKKPVQYPTAGHKSVPLGGKDEPVTNNRAYWGEEVEQINDMGRGVKEEVELEEMGGLDMKNLQKPAEISFHGKEGYAVTHKGKTTHHDTHEQAVKHAKELSSRIHDMTEGFYADKKSQQQTHDVLKKAIQKKLMEEDEPDISDKASRSTANMGSKDIKLGKKGEPMVTGAAETINLARIIAKHHNDISDKKKGLYHSGKYIRHAQAVLTRHPNANPEYVELYHKHKAEVFGRIKSNAADEY
jgi:hypothetical protein